MEKQGVDIERSTLDEIGEGIADLGSGLLTIGKFMILIPLGIAGIVMIVILVNLIRNPKKSLSNAMMLTPQGRALGMSKGLKAK